MTRKAAFDMSLGFIVTVVFAIVLLSLALVWLQGVFGGFTGLTDDLFQVSQAKIRDSFSKGTTNFAVWPNQYDLSPGERLKMSAGIKNNVEDGLDHKFVIRVFPSTASESVWNSAKWCKGGSFEGCATLYQNMLTWVTYDKSITQISIRGEGFKFIDILVPADAVQGTYMFNVVSCFDKDGNQGLLSDCRVENRNHGNAAEPISITVT